MKKKTKLIIAGAIIFFIVIFVGPWPVNNTPFKNTGYAKTTFNRIARVKPTQVSGQLYAGAAKFDITPPLNVPLGGYSARHPKENKGVIDKVYVRVISISNGSNTVSIVSPEILLPLPELVNAVLEKTHLKREQIYFTATHTHSGPGGFAHGFIAEQNLGSFSKNYFAILSNAIAQAINTSRHSMQPAVLNYNRFSIRPKLVKTYMSNELNESDPAYNTLHILQITNRDTHNNIANLVTFSMHPTILGVKNYKVSGEYPSIIMKNFETQFKGITVFAIGAPGGISPVTSTLPPEQVTLLDKRNYIGKELSELFINALKHPDNDPDLQTCTHVHWEAKSAVIQSHVFNIDLPGSNYHLSDDWRLSPYLVRIIFHKESTYIEALRIGKLVFLSYPADFSGNLAKRLENWGDENGILPWVNSFNGDYIGYVMPSEYEGEHNYVMRGVNIYGPWSGDYFLTLSKQIMRQLNGIQ